MQKLIFVTWNPMKLSEVQAYLYGHEVINHKVDLPELQWNIEDIARAKAQEAYAQIGQPCFVEDTGLKFDALQWLPGPYIKHFLESLGAEHLPRLLDGFDSNTATAVTCIALALDENHIELFVWEKPGKIVEHCGADKFGRDPIFQPEWCEITYAEMTKEEKNQISHRSIALQKFKTYLDASTTS